MVKYICLGLQLGQVSAGLINQTKDAQKNWIQYILDI